MTFRFSIQRILILTLILALVIPYVTPLMRTVPGIQSFQIADLDLEAGLKDLDPNVLVLASGSTSGGSEMVCIDNDFLILTETGNQTLFVQRLFEIVDESVESNGWTIERSAGSSDFHWIRFKNNKTTYVMQMWLDEMTPDERTQLSQLNKAGIMVRMSLNGFLMPQ